jgi:hypothetical protein
VIEAPSDFNRGFMQICPLNNPSPSVFETMQPITNPKWTQSDEILDQLSLRECGLRKTYLNLGETPREIGFVTFISVEADECNLIL